MKTIELIDQMQADLRADLKDLKVCKNIADEHFSIICGDITDIPTKDEIILSAEIQACEDLMEAIREFRHKIVSIKNDIEEAKL